MSSFNDRTTTEHTFLADVYFYGEVEFNSDVLFKQDVKIEGTLDLDFLQEIVEIQRDILDEAGKYKGTYLEDFDFDYPEIEYSVFGSDICGGRN